MPVHDILNVTTLLPRTIRGAMPYETLALSLREMYGHGHSVTTVEMRQRWEDVAQWMQYMLGEARVEPTSATNLTPKLVRHIPEPLRYTDSGFPALSIYDRRRQWCTGLSQIDMGGNVTELPMAEQDGGLWPRADWTRYQGTWETPPFTIRGSDEVFDIATRANAGPIGYAGAHELYRYVVRDRKVYSREQPIPAASTAGGFKTINDSLIFGATDRRPIGQVGFRVISMADVSYKWVRVPRAWPPPPGWQFPAGDFRWPPAANPGAVAPGVNRPVRDTFIGRINSDYFDCAAPEGYCWQPGELLYMGYEEYVYYDAIGDMCADYTFRFRFKEGSWNRFLSALGVWREVSLTGLSTGQKPYETADFNKLFEYSAAA